MSIPERALTAITNVLTICASVIAIYIFVVKRKVISSVFRVLINYSLHMTFAEFVSKLERLNYMNANESENKEEVINIFNEILGQIKGNKKLKNHFKNIIPKVKSIAEGRRNITEQNKRAIVSQLREMLKHLDIDTYSKIAGE